MALLKIKLLDLTGAALAAQAVKVSGSGVLQSNAEGMTQFLIDSGVSLEIEINGSVVWSGDSAQLEKDEVFQSTDSAFARVRIG